MWSDKDVGRKSELFVSNLRSVQLRLECFRNKDGVWHATLNFGKPKHVAQGRHCSWMLQRARSSLFSSSGMLDRLPTFRALVFGRCRKLWFTFSGIDFPRHCVEVKAFDDGFWRWLCHLFRLSQQQVSKTYVAIEIARLFRSKWFLKLHRTPQRWSHPVRLRTSACAELLNLSVCVGKFLTGQKNLNTANVVRNLFRICSDSEQSEQW